MKSIKKIVSESVPYNGEWNHDEILAKAYESYKSECKIWGRTPSKKYPEIIKKNINLLKEERTLDLKTITIQLTKAERDNFDVYRDVGNSIKEKISHAIWDIECNL